jgi:hypothetical protein
MFLALFPNACDIGIFGVWNISDQIRFYAQLKQNPVRDHAMKLPFCVALFPLFRW